MQIFSATRTPIFPIADERTVVLAMCLCMQVSQLPLESKPDEAILASEQKFLSGTDRRPATRIHMPIRAHPGPKDLCGKWLRSALAIEP